MAKVPHELARSEFIALVGGLVAVLVVGDGLLIAALAGGGSAGDGAGSDDAPTYASRAIGPYDSHDFPSARSGSGTGSSAGVIDEDTVAALPWNLRLVNRDWRLVEDFAPDDLAELPESRWAERGREHFVDARVYDDLVAMLEAAEEDGVDPLVLSSYRPYAYQEDLFARRVARAEEEEGLEGDAAVEAAAFWVAPPGASEHQTGLAVDIVDAGYTELDEGQETTATQQWLMEHCAEYGFILRYPTDKSAVTGIGYEPWHYRYVGREAAPAITESGLCFEEWIAAGGAKDLAEDR